MLKPSDKAFATATSMANASKFLDHEVGHIPGIAKITEATGLNYSQAWCFLTRKQVEKRAGQWDKAKLASEAVVAGPDSAKMREFKAWIVQARQEGNSWGLIGVRANRPEGLVRKLFKEASGVKSEGLRNGKGGRWLMDEQPLYQGQRAVTGIALPSPMKRAEIKSYAKGLDEGTVKPATVKRPQAIPRVKKASGSVKVTKVAPAATAAELEGATPKADANAKA